MNRGRLGGLAAVVLASVALVGCGGSDGDEAAAGAGDTLTIYSGREEELVAPLFELYERETGTKLEIRYGDSAELAATIAEEGDSSPADVFFAQDGGSLGAVGGEGLLAELDEETLARVDERFRDPEGRWVGTSGRVRVIAYNTEELSEGDLPTTIWDFTKPEWKGKIGFPPTNASFQAFVTAMRLTEGDDRTRQWLEAIGANDPKLYENNSQTVEAVAAGEVLVGFVNHYYLYQLIEEEPDAPVANHYLRRGDPGALVNAAGVGIVASSDDREAAQRFVDFLLSEQGQEFYATAEEAEYPLIDGVEPREGLPPLEELHGPDVALGDLGPELERTLELITEAGLTS